MKAKVTCLVLFYALFALRIATAAPAGPCEDHQTPKAFAIDALSVAESFGLRPHGEAFPRKPGSLLVAQLGRGTFQIYDDSRTVLYIKFDEDAGRVEKLESAFSSPADLLSKIKLVEKEAPGLFALVQAWVDNSKAALTKFEIPKAWNVRIMNLDLILGRIDWQTRREKATKSLLEQAVTSNRQ